MQRLIVALTAFILIAFTGCDTLKQTSNTTGGVFSLNGVWELTSNTPENTLIGTRVTVVAFVPEARITTLVNNTQCYRENDLKWKNIASNNEGGFLLNNLIGNCTGATMTYQPATLSVSNTNQVRLVGANSAGVTNTQVWKRVTQ